MLRLAKGSLHWKSADHTSNLDFALSRNFFLTIRSDRNNAEALLRRRCSRSRCPVLRDAPGPEACACQGAGEHPNFKSSVSEGLAPQPRTDHRDRRWRALLTAWASRPRAARWRSRRCGCRRWCSHCTMFKRMLAVSNNARTKCSVALIGAPTAGRIVNTPHREREDASGGHLCLFRYPRGATPGDGSGEARRALGALSWARWARSCQAHLLDADLRHGSCCASTFQRSYE